jgi:cytoplasmic iron level regulating protein YaaA (DUF328/UPF0246 family)
MMIVISPAKTLDFESEKRNLQGTQPLFQDEASKVAAIMRKQSEKKLSALMDISKELAHLNYIRYQQWGAQTDDTSKRHALLAFKGEVYIGLQAETFTDEQMAYAQDHLRILSGLYGLLRPLDLIEAYRLEMGTKIKIGRKNDLYQFWLDKITKQLKEEMKQTGDSVLINLASNEYFKSINVKKLGVNIISPQFKEEKNGELKMISFFAKKARGMMSRFILTNNISDPEHLTAFSEDGYRYEPSLSTPEKPLFVRSGA